MREIKFRKWSKNTEGKWRMKQCSAEDLTSERFVLSCDGELMQYTGLKDAKGREIHEGDVVSLQHEFAGLGEPKEELFEVEYSEKRAGFIPFCVMRECTDEIGNYQISGQDVEVIGNIYENPELVEELLEENK